MQLAYVIMVVDPHFILWSTPKQRNWNPDFLCCWQWRYARPMLHVLRLWRRSACKLDKKQPASGVRSSGKGVASSLWYGMFKMHGIWLRRLLNMISATANLLSSVEAAMGPETAPAVPAAPSGSAAAVAAAPSGGAILQASEAACQSGS